MCIREESKLGIIKRKHNQKQTERWSRKRCSGDPSSSEPPSGTSQVGKVLIRD